MKHIDANYTLVIDSVKMVDSVNRGGDKGFDNLGATDGEYLHFETDKLNKRVFLL